MRSSQHAKSKKGSKCKNNKLSKRPKSIVASNIRNDIKMENLEIINEALRIHKTRGEKNSWKLIPKDSREVYRARRRRRESLTKQPLERDRSRSEDSSYYTREPRAAVPKVAKKPPKKVKKDKKEKKTRTRRRYRRSRSHMSGSSYTSGESNLSTSFSTSRSTTDMDYE